MGGDGGGTGLSEFRWTVERLIEGSEHVQYEIEMLIETAIRSSHETDRIEHNMIVETFAMHARVLMDFLLSDCSEGHTDMAAYRYVGARADWKKLCPYTKEDWAQSRLRVNKEIAHLTSGRLGLKEQEKRWLRIALCNEILHALCVWMSHVDRTRLSPVLTHWWDTLPQRYELMTTSTEGPVPNGVDVSCT